MSKVWEFYENLDDYVYVSDMDSYELLYLNKKAREAFGLLTQESLKGKKCYEVLQNCSEPCSLCTNSRLKEGEFLKWGYYNPIIDEHLLLLDTMIEVDGRKCRFEMALDNSAKAKADRAAELYEDMETKINSAVGIALQKPSPDETIEYLLEFIGNALDGERAYIFEKNEDGSDDNTYEWVAAGIMPVKDNLQNVPSETSAIWYNKFRLHQDVVIKNLEDIRDADPLMYELLKPQNIHSLIVVPLCIGQEVAAFFGVDNPPLEMFDYASGMLHIMARFIEASIKRRDLVRELKKISYYDQQTGFGNRHALQSFVEHADSQKSMGAIFSDITGLKKVNDTLGHKAGDEMIAGCAECVRQVFGKAMLFRYGGDELVVLYTDVEENEFSQLVEELRENLIKSKLNMAIGSVWRDAGSVNIDHMLSEAETLMYKDKALYYQRSGEDRRRC